MFFFLQQPTQHNIQIRKLNKIRNIKCGKGGITRIIYRKLTEHANYLVTSSARKKPNSNLFQMVSELPKIRDSSIIYTIT
jgi:hypothetical protein